MMGVALIISLLGLSVSLVLCAYRALVGPSVADRVVAVDAVSVVLMGLVVVGSMALRETKYLPYVLVLAALGFVGTISYAKYLERGVIIERDRD